MANYLKAMCRCAVGAIACLTVLSQTHSANAEIIKCHAKGQAPNGEVLEYTFVIALAEEHDSQIIALDAGEAIRGDYTSMEFLGDGFVGISILEWGFGSLPSSLKREVFIQTNTPPDEPLIGYFMDWHWPQIIKAELSKEGRPFYFHRTNLVEDFLAIGSCD